MAAMVGRQTDLANMRHVACWPIATVLLFVELKADRIAFVLRQQDLIVGQGGVVGLLLTAALGLPPWSNLLAAA